MLAVLGIDAAWTASQPSGVALAAFRESRWGLVAAEPSYEHFLARGEMREPRTGRPSGSLPQARELLASSHAMCGWPAALVAIDMPLSLRAIEGRRVSDNAVSVAYGGRRCGTHSPSALRPGPISDDLRKSFEAAGYPLLTEAIAAPGLIEVFPHPALLELSGAKERLPYKAGKIPRYWPELNREDRRRRLYRQWSEIVDLLDCKIEEVRNMLPLPRLDAPGHELKSFEDKLDAVICAWVAICALKGQVKAFGDRESAIWVPAAGTDAIARGNPSAAFYRRSKRILHGPNAAKPIGGWDAQD